MKKVYKYGTGYEIPDGAVYLSTQVEKNIYYTYKDTILTGTVEENRLVWHYFLVEVGDE